MRLRAAFLTLWQRASDMLAVTDRPSLNDDDGACAFRDMPGTYLPGVLHDHAEQLDALAHAIGHHQVCLDGLDRATPTSRADAARKRKYKYRDRAEAVFPALMEGTAGLARSVAHARL